MKHNKFISALLAGAMVFTSTSLPGYLQASAQGVALEDGLVAAYSFDGETLADEKGGSGASAIVTGLNAYSGAPVYEAGKEGKALRLGDYGLKLNREDLGDNFTVSLWLNWDGSVVYNQSVLFLGYHNPEKWLAVGGTEHDGLTNSRFWANGNGYSWTTLGSADLSGGWHQLTLVGSSGGVAAYLDGELCGSGTSNGPLTGADQDIYVGVNNWDEEFTGLVDEVKVYDRTLSEAEIYRLYDSETSTETLLDQTGITATSSLSMVVGRTQSIEISMHPVVAAAVPTVTYETSDDTVAQVSQDGVVTAVASGTAVITTTVTLGSVTKTAQTTVTVGGTLDDRLVASFDFENTLDNGVEGGTDAQALGYKLGSYTGEVVYEQGRDGQAVRLGDYGLKLNQQDVGDEYTVSFWVKNHSALAENQVLLLLGYHDPENWMALSGSQSNTSKLKFWGNGGGFSWTTLATTSVPADTWHQITITGTQGQATLYRDGVSLGTVQSNNPLTGSNADIYLGVNNWDALFDGLVDEVRVYNIALSQEEVQEQALDEFQDMFQQSVEGTLEAAQLLGDNDSAQDVRYDLPLPQIAGGMDVTWTSSNPDVIATDGSVTSPETDTDVSLTAVFQNGLLRYEMRFDFTVTAFDRSQLDSLLEQARAVDTTLLTPESAQRLAQAVEAAEGVENTFAAVDQATQTLRFTLDHLYYRDEAVNPFAFIQEAEAQVELEAGETAKVFTLPDSVKDYVTVTYTTENENVATYQDGVVTAAGAGKTIITATVTAKYDGFQMAYSTAVEVLGQPEPTPEPSDVDKTLLEKTIAYAETLSTDGVTDSAVAAFQKALAQAKAVMADTNATQEQVNAAWDNLLEGIWGLGLTQGDKTLLEQLITKADDMMADADKYVETNWQQLVDALAAAKDVAADGDAMDEDIQPVAEALLNAILAQRFKADKSILEGLIGQAEGMDLSGYTAESVDSFRTALATAQAVMADATLSADDQAKVDDAVAALSAAMDGLTAEGETQPSDQPESSQNPETTDQPQATEKPENVPQTGDSAQLMGYVAALATAVMALGAVTVVRRRRRN